MIAQDAFEQWRPLMRPGEHDPQGSVGFALGSTPDESFANMMAYLRDAAAKLDQPPPPPSFEPANLRNISTFREAVVIEGAPARGLARPTRRSARPSASLPTSPIGNFS
jgi:hypothetical protein